MAADGYFRRRVQVLVGPLPAWEGGGNEQQALTFTGDGTPDGFRISFTVVKQIMATANPSTVRIYNLSAKTRSALRTQGAQMRILVGWEQTGLFQVFKGGLLAAVSAREGADVVTTLSGLPYYGGAARTVRTNSYRLGTQLKDVVLDLARALPGVSVDPANVAVPDFAFGSQGWSAHGTAEECLDSLSRSLFFTWRVTDQVFYATLDGENSGGRVLLVDPTNGLKRAEPSLAWSHNLGDPIMAVNGITVSCLLRPEAEPGAILALKSGVNPELNNRYTIHTVRHSGDTHSQQFDTQLESLWTRNFSLGA